MRSQRWRLLVEAWHGLRRRRALPLQCLIYLPHWQLASMLAKRRRAAPDIVYLDGVRAAAFLPLLRRSFPRARIVVDMDDLMSRRWPSLRRAGVGLTFGFLERYLPVRLILKLRHGLLARCILRYETRTLRALELRTAGQADLTVFNSPSDAQIFGRLVSQCNRWPAALTAILPPAPRVTPVRWTGEPRIRFVLIGTDQLPQNWLSIDRLVSLWQRLRPPAELIIVGKLRRRHQACANVAYAGFIADFRKIYTAGSVLLSPSFVAGGVKTKVVEAFAYGCPVMGNAATFDGLPLPRDYPLRLTMQAIETIVAAPGQHLGAFATAARMGQRLVNGEVRGALFAERWERALASGLITELHDARRQSAATVPAASGLGRAASRAVTSMRG